MPDSADYRQRLALINRLSSLPATQLDTVILALKPTQGLIPPSTAKPGDRASALFEWAESPMGCGLEKLRHVLEAVLQDDSDYGLPDTKPAPTRKDSNEKILIDAVWTEVEDRLRQSLHNAILIRLDMAEQRSQVSRPWDSQLRTADQAPQSLAPDTHILEVFDRRDVGGKLLILGNPGSGKTTTMLDLAAELIKRANTQPDHPIPVMFNLSSWQSAKQGITDWLLSELKLKYGVSQKLGQTWLQQKTLLPLFDGLDELPPERQEPVVEQINEWLRSGEGPSRLLVCSRIEEYELYAAKLVLNGAICLEPLTDRQLQCYLNSMKMGELWNTLQQDAELLALVRTPLLLSVSILANEGIDLEQWQQKQTTQERMTYLLDAYVERRLHEAVKSQEYPAGKQPTAKQTRHWLVWLAKELRQTPQTEFLIEGIQPVSIADKKNRILYYLSTILFVVFLAVTLSSFVLELHIGFLIGTLLGVIAIINCALDQIFLSENFFLSRTGILNGILLGLFMTVIIGTLATATGSVLDGILWGFSWGSFSGFFGSILLGLKGKEIDNKNFPNQGMWNSLRNTVLQIGFLTGAMTIASGFINAILNGSAIMSLLLGEKVFTDSAILMNHFSFKVLTFELFSGAIQGSISGFIIGIIWNLSSKSISGINCLKHVCLRLVLFYEGNIPWDYARFLNHCTERLLLQRVGGRYRFIHKLVQEHFAAMEP
ncbi:MAG: NACHT domain-containing protein [Leptolyngbya sp. SIO1D8]|nr:NACHT domain-containing protein [Leptolyngbya sp. SIO1D8]